MSKKIVIGAIILASIFTFNVIGYAGGGNNVENQNPIVQQKPNEQKPQDVLNEPQKIKEEQINKCELIKPEEDVISTTDDDSVILLSGRAPEGTDIMVQIFRTIDLSGKKFNLKNLPEDKDYELISEETIQVGKMSSFAKELHLTLGINKVMVVFNTQPNKVVVKKLIFVNDKDKVEEKLDEDFKNTQNIGNVLDSQDK